ncbi:MAG: HypC/HybG/HupF family hydrogenase formation chaperone [Gammaproteobacteria bacterium]|nr:HypC/HybG/HupF family hydrogenase formation chaperone [Gammaproteobacteria bacterium]
MCLAIPMRVDHIEGYTAHCSAGGVEREVNLFLLQDQPVAVGDFVMVHVGYAIEKVQPEEAHKRRALFEQMSREESGAAEDA